MKEFNKPKVEFIAYEKSDVIATSTGCGCVKLKVVECGGTACPENVTQGCTDIFTATSY